ncbi:NTP transferase domain-containing protein [Photobacterium carnosum]|uniref:sugar phosphate nucleotidyltransferase n=1 Tax=Photobacterium carnosum TaxID=2023717 RepID=UPI001C927DD2|nr:sugar phosphate nucleotidyltransferase [Photobacterium carnosum]MBY3790487.1 NTP transferase domain-containing protein [Photobacterium carnosum]MCD9535530.1 NTP transferase domain-containing protein [Photobacterium carnosum]
MNAIILAAGLGSRLRPITNTIPKSLIKVNNRPLIEIQIENLLDIGVENITIVVGYLSNCFEYLKDKYDVKIIMNEYYAKYNNIYTMSLVIDQLSNSYVIDADVFMTNNFLVENPKQSLYFSGMKNSVGEWELFFNDDDVITDIQYSNGDSYILSGVSFWSGQDSLIIKDALQRTIKETYSWENLYWDDIVKKNLSKLNIKLQRIESSDWYEIDSVSDYEDILEIYPN